MNFDALAAIVIAFFTSPQVSTILALIVMDLLTGIAAAIHLRQFDWRSLGDFYLSNVLPFILGYLALWIGVTFAAAQWLGPYADIIGEATVTLGWLAIIGTLVGSIRDNLTEIGLTLPTTPEPHG